MRKMGAPKKGIFNEVLSEYSKLVDVFNNNRKWIDMSENELWQELCLCILSSNVPFELARSAFLHLRKGYLQLEWIAGTPNSERIIADELSRRIYFPKTTRGARRRYRFPNARARDIVQAAKVISSGEKWLSKLLRNNSSENEVRDVLVDKISGLGLKGASHFLRNIRYSTQLAIIDSHVLSFLSSIGVVESGNTKSLTRNVYLELESRLQEICDEYGMNLSIFDMAIWRCMRRK